jgi:type I restriction-modification system DNA methylase subunit
MMESWDATTINPDERRLIRDLTNSFLDFDSVYNSTLFARHECEEWTVENDALKDIIKNFYKYNFEYLDADILGSIYEDYLGHAIEEKSDGEGITLEERSDERREGGIFYTPVPVVEYIVETTLGKRLDNILNDVRDELSSDDADFEKAYNIFSRVEDVRVVDISCGSGSFLIKAYDEFIRAYDEYDELLKEARSDEMGLSEYSTVQSRPKDYRQRILKNNIFGVDLDSQATEIASVNLFLKALNQGEAVPTMLEKNIRRGNSLLNGSPEEVAETLDISVDDAKDLGAFDWKENFDQIFSDDGFDIVVGNPPWGANTESYAEWVEDNYELATGQYDSYELFVELSGELLNEGGLLGFIIPDSLFSDKSDNIRKWLTERQLNQVHKLGEGVFPGVFAATAIIQYSNISPDPENEIEVSLLQKEDREQMLGRGGDALSNVINNKKHTTQQKRFSDDEDYTFTVWAGEKDHAIMDRMEDGIVEWSDVLDNGRGDEIGKDGNIMRCPACMEWDTYPQSRAASKGGGYYSKTCTHCNHDYEFEDAVETRSIIRESQPSSGDWKKLYVGEDVNRYRITGNRWIDDSVSGIGLKDNWRFEPPKLLIREAGFGFYSTVEYETGRCLKSVLSFRPLENPDEPYDQYDIEYFLGMLNSRAMMYYYCKEQGIVEWQSYPRHPQSFIKSLPIPEIDFSDDEERQQYNEFVELVKDAIDDNDSQVDMELDWEIEKKVLDLYDIPEEERSHIWNELKKLARLRIVRELSDQSR